MCICIYNNNNNIYIYIYVCIYNICMYIYIYIYIIWAVKEGDFLQRDRFSWLNKNCFVFKQFTENLFTSLINLTLTEVDQGPPKYLRQSSLWKKLNAWSCKLLSQRTPFLDTPLAIF